MANTKNPTKTSDYEALIEEIKNDNQPNKVKVQRLEKVWRDMGKAAWSDTHKEIAWEVRRRAYDVAQEFGGFAV